MEEKILKPIARFISRKPAVNKGLCIKCGVCIEACPVEPKAINFIKDKKSPPQYDYKKCIRCYCCQEVCPYKAIYVKTPLIGKIIIR